MLLKQLGNFLLCNLYSIFKSIVFFFLSTIDKTLKNSQLQGSGRKQENKTKNKNKKINQTYEHSIVLCLLYMYAHFFFDTWEIFHFFGVGWVFSFFFFHQQLIKP